MTKNKDWRCLSFDYAHVFLIGPGEMPEFNGIAVTDQSDGWVCLRLSGPKAVDVLARLVPLDLRRTAFADDACAKTLLGHMPLLITRSEGGFDLMTFRSMTQTAIHELEHAMKAVTARN
jgi:sarcosine oxidase subunit gamma